ncbi:MAG: Lrp/AsnC family transcriptional regulator [Chloroflexi bacterium]|nr:Lrp/AsnC family transcriptional regulator [Chloroflexota bacterium]
MNDTDTRILQHLMEDASKSNVEIAKAIGVSEETVRRRRAGLQRDGVYEVVAIPNYRKLGYGVELLLGIEADGSQLDEVAEALSELEEVYRVSCTTGSFNIFAWLTVRSMNDVTTVLNEKIRNISGIDRVVTFYCIETMKQWTATGV